MTDELAGAQRVRCPPPNSPVVSLRARRTVLAGAVYGAVYRLSAERKAASYS
jgi:hypothetical protein